MLRRSVSKVVVTYTDGETEEFHLHPEDSPRHTQHQFYRKGDMSVTQGRIAHAIQWVENRSMWPKVEGDARSN